MCNTFHLEFTDEKGIFAWATPLIREEFSGPTMKPGDKWKIHLGRCINLDQDDPHGSVFIEGLLEDACLFPLHSEKSDRKYARWETVKDGPGVWVTRLMESRDESKGDKSAKSDELENHEYVRLLQQWDKELENPDHHDDGPVVLVDGCGSRGFMLVDEEEEEDDEDEGELGGDTNHDTDEEMLSDSEAHERPDSIWTEHDVAEDSTGSGERESDDVAGSDWDSDEDLSGDDLNGLKTMNLCLRRYLY
jgi:hypothetical protein